jgi:hypothetical protein
MRIVSPDLAVDRSPERIQNSIRRESLGAVKAEPKSSRSLGWVIDAFSLRATGRRRRRREENATARDGAV